VSGAEAAKSRDDVKRPVLHHVTFKTTRLQEMVDWYANVVGIEVNFQNPGIAFTSNDAANHRVAFLASPVLSDDAQKTAHNGMHHSAFEYETVDDLLQTWVRLKEQGILPHMSLDHGLTLSFYYLDPDGNSVELQADWYGDWAKSTNFIRTSEKFAANPIGVFVDPAQLVAARAAGASVEELYRRSYGGEFPATAPQDLRMDLPPP
jgi:catechol 2,3-dioxygenase